MKQAEVNTALASLLAHVGPGVTGIKMFEPVEIFSKLRFTHADLKGDLIVAWLKYFFRHKIEGSQSGKNDPILELDAQYEAFDLLMSIGGTEVEDLTRLFKRIPSDTKYKIPLFKKATSESDTRYKAFVESMQDLAKRERQSSDFLTRKGSKTPKDFYKELNIDPPEANVAFCQWLRYGERYERDLNLNKHTDGGEDVYGSMANELLNGDRYEEMAQLIESLSNAPKFQGVAHNIGRAMRRQEASSMLESGDTPESAYYRLFKTGLPPAENTINFLLLLEFVKAYKSKNNYTTNDLVEFLTRGHEGFLLYYGSVFEKLENSTDFKEIVDDALKTIFEEISEQKIRLLDYVKWYKASIQDLLDLIRLRGEKASADADYGFNFDLI
ncbi:hypothetical protein Plhal304r1_c082g0167141 [Plasmopara halstedii]